MLALPERFKERMKLILGDEYEAFVSSYGSDRIQGLRFNRLKENFREEKDTLERVSWSGDGRYYAPQDRPGKHPYHEAGAYYIQEPSAMAAVELLAPRPGEKVLDLCAAPGGKTTHIASKMRNEGLLISNEIHPSRAKILSQNVERMGASNTVVTNERPEKLAARFPEFFDRILVDAPCSGEGMFRKDKEALSQWSQEGVALCAARQQKILDQAARMLKPGGRMVYSTCTFAPEEDEGTVGCFLRNHPDYQVEPVQGFHEFDRGHPEWLALVGGEVYPEDYGLEHTMRIFPHKLKGEGHYMAVLTRRGKGEKEAVRPLPVPAYDRDPSRLREYRAFCKDTLREASWLQNKREYVWFGDQLYLIPSHMPELKGLKILRPGLHLGTQKKKRFEPSHALALYLSSRQVLRCYNMSADAPEAVQYLRGEAIVPGKQWDISDWNASPGWVLMCVDGYGLGWGKYAGGILKNHYPKGLRWI